MLYICVLFDLQNHQQYLSMHVLVFRRELEEEEEEETPLPPLSPMMMMGQPHAFRTMMQYS